jgi:hypothetical protein
LSDAAAQENQQLAIEQLAELTVRARELLARHGKGQRQALPRYRLAVDDCWTGNAKQACCNLALPQQHD